MLDGEQIMPAPSCCSKKDLPTDSTAPSLKRPPRIQTPYVDGLRPHASNTNYGQRSKQAWEDHSPSCSQSNPSGVPKQAEVAEATVGPEETHGNIIHDKGFARRIA